MYTDTTRKKRSLYQRSVTVATIPTGDIIEVDNENDDSMTATELSKLLHPQISPTTSRESSSELEKSDADDELRPLDLHRSSIKSKRARFQQNRSLSMAAEQQLVPLLSDRESLARHRRPANPASQAKNQNTPTLLFSKVKERIKEKVFQSSEWSNAAATVQERRLRAMGAFELSRKEQECEHIQMRDMQGRRGRPRSHSDQGKAVVASTTSTPEGRDAARAAYRRRRSISEDTYDRPPQLGQVSVCYKTGKGSGIVCSTEDLQDLQAIVYDPRQRRPSPIPIRVNMRAQSLDSTGMSKALLDPTTSVTGRLSNASTCSTVSSVPTDSIESTSNNGREDGDSLRNSSSQQTFPGIVLDEISKERLLEGDETAEDTGQPPEIVFDENGQTWDIYGAEVDPEILGHAIQTHLEKMMQKHMNTTAEDKLDSPSATAQSAADNFWWRFLCLFSRKRTLVR